MVILNKIYTRTGDDGTTALGNGERRKKYDPRIVAYGTLDEVNAAFRKYVVPEKMVFGVAGDFSNAAAAAATTKAAGIVAPAPR